MSGNFRWGANSGPSLPLAVARVCRVRHRQRGGLHERHVSPRGKWLGNSLQVATFPDMDSSAGGNPMEALQPQRAALSAEMTLLLQRAAGGDPSAAEQI